MSHANPLQHCAVEVQQSYIEPHAPLLLPLLPLPPLLLLLPPPLLLLLLPPVPLLPLPLPLLLPVPPLLLLPPPDPELLAPPHCLGHEDDSQESSASLADAHAGTKLFDSHCWTRPGSNVPPLHTQLTKSMHPVAAALSCELQRLSTHDVHAGLPVPNTVGAHVPLSCD